MRSYYAHLESSKLSIQTKQAIASRPILRSSAIFPVIHEKEMKSRALFLGYWQLKRSIHEVVAVITLRDDNGTAIYRQFIEHLEPKAYSIEVGEWLAFAGRPVEHDFHGSLELEFFSTHHLVFPYPAVVINYYGPHFSTFVHTAQRVYNDYDDKRVNSEKAVNEAGFNIYSDGSRTPFISLINGLQEVENGVLKLEVYNDRNECLVANVDLGTLHPYQTIWVFPERYLDLSSFLHGGVGTMLLNFPAEWIFPRLVAGNMDRIHGSMSITHTYYDCSKATTDKDYWMAPTEGNHAMSLMVPSVLGKDNFTRIYFYPIYSPSNFTIDVEFYDQNGKNLGCVKDALQISAPQEQFVSLDFRKLCQQTNSICVNDKGNNKDLLLSARIIARALPGGRLPSRIKLGLDLGHDESHLPCNICNNLQPYIAAWQDKPKTFKWAPLLADQKGVSVWIFNSSPAINGPSPCHVDLDFYREEDTAVIHRSLTLPSLGSHVIELDNDHELIDFFHNKPGWITINAYNPYANAYYFVRHSSGVIGGDHSF